MNDRELERARAVSGFPQHTLHGSKSEAAHSRLEIRVSKTRNAHIDTVVGSFLFFLRAKPLLKSREPHECVRTHLSRAPDARATRQTSAAAPTAALPTRPSAAPVRLTVSRLTKAERVCSLSLSLCDAAAAQIDRADAAPTQVSGVVLVFRGGARPHTTRHQSHPHDHCAHIVTSSPFPRNY